MIRELHVADVSLAEYLMTKSTLWHDMRPKSAKTASGLNIYLCRIMDAQLNLEKGRFCLVLNYIYYICPNWV